MVEFEIRYKSGGQEVGERVHASVHPAPGDVVRMNGEAFRVTGWRVKVPGGLSVRLAEIDIIELQR